MMRAGLALSMAGLATLLDGPARAAPLPLVLNCYVLQPGVGQFVRNLAIDPARGVVAIADGLGGQSPRYVGAGRLIAYDTARVVYDFASRSSGGRTQIDRRTGAFVYNDGRTVIRGSCQPSSL